MIKADGSYPTSFDSNYGPWKHVMPLDDAVAKAILLEVAKNDEFYEDGAGHILVNKMFRVFQEHDHLTDGSCLWAVYNHDGIYYIIRCPVEDAKNLHCWGKE